MKKIITFTALFAFIFAQTSAFALQSTDVSNTENMVIPKWEDYVPKKYQNPRTDFTKKSGTTELIWGIVLTDLLVTAPIGIPMICHGTTKCHHVSYLEKKEKFENGLAYAETIKSPQERQEYYNKLIKECGLKKQK